MESLLVKGGSAEDIKLVAALAKKIGLTVEFIENNYAVNEPVTEWEHFSDEQKQALTQGLHEADTDQTEDMDDVLREFRKKYE